MHTNQLRLCGSSVPGAAHYVACAAAHARATVPACELAGFAVVKRGRDKVTSEPVAIKVRSSNTGQASHSSSTQQPGICCASCCTALQKVICNSVQGSVVTMLVFQQSSGLLFANASLFTGCRFSCDWSVASAVHAAAAAAGMQLLYSCSCCGVPASLRSLATAAPIMMLLCSWQCNKGVCARQCFPKQCHHLPVMMFDIWGWVRTYNTHIRSIHS